MLAHTRNRLSMPRVSNSSNQDLKELITPLRMVIHSTISSDENEHILCFQFKEAPKRPDTRRCCIPKSEASGFELKISQQRASNSSNRRCLKVTQNDKGAFWLRGSVIILFSILFYVEQEKIYQF